LGLEFVLGIAALLLAYHLGMRYVITYRLTTRAPAVAKPEVDCHGTFFGAQTPMFRAFKTALQVINIYLP
jgi:hypothetical protein